MFFWLKHRWTGFWLLILGLGALILFFYGFFPLKYHSGKLAHLDDLPNFIDGVSIDGHEVYNAGEHSVVLMVIDGLRYDFATEEYMPFTGGLLNNKSASIYVSVAEPPTVTMPRIKSPERKKEKAQWRRTINFWRDIFAMMTGSISTFADVALNFGAPAVRGDSVLRVAAAHGRQSVLYGDDTWLRLFPGLWAENDGTTSFFVSDYTEVDNNVTRHLDKALAPDKDKKPTFDFLVLHYLGLDHIGHLEGARSPKIKPKLVEMDSIVKKIYTAMQHWDRPGVLIICGDHGMRDAGGHGGASPAEVLVPIVVMKSDGFRCPHPSGPGPTVGQIDIAPTVAWLLRVPPPGDSAGRVLPALMPFDTRQHLYLLHTLAKHSVRQGIPKDTEFYKQYERAEKQFAQFLATGQMSAAKIAKEFYEESLEAMSKYLTRATADFDLYATFFATFLLYFIAVALVCVTLFSLVSEPTSLKNYTHQASTISVLVAFTIMLGIFSATLVVSCFITETKSAFCSFSPLWTIAFVAAAFTLTFVFFVIKVSLSAIRDTSILRNLNAIDYLLIIGTLFHSWSFFGTSFIEEEHMTWYFLWHTLMMFVLARTTVVAVAYISKSLSGATEVQEKPELERRMFTVGVSVLPKWVMLIALHRYLRTMNQTGDRWLFLPDTADWLNEPQNAMYLQGHLLIGTLLTLKMCLGNVKHMNNYMGIHNIFTIIAITCILCYRMTSGSLFSFLTFFKTWDSNTIVDVFWAVLITQFVFEILSYIGVFNVCGCKPEWSNKFGYTKTKDKTEDYIYEPMDEPWNLESVKLSLSRSLSHIMLNDLMLIATLLMRPHNVIMVPSVIVTCELTSACLDHGLLDGKGSRGKEIADLIGQSLAHIWIGMVFFFYQGNSNSLASVDLGAGYVGLREYSPVRVAARMGLHAYAGPALAGAALYCRMAARAGSWKQYLDSVWRVSNLLALHRVYGLAVYTVVVLVFRHHLFVWSVFSPKLLYDFVATVFTVQALATIGQIIVLTNLTNTLARLFTCKPMLM